MKGKDIRGDKGNDKKRWKKDVVGDKNKRVRHRFAFAWLSLGSMLPHEMLMPKGISIRHKGVLK